MFPQNLPHVSYETQDVCLRHLRDTVRQKLKLCNRGATRAVHSQIRSLNATLKPPRSGKQEASSEGSPKCCRWNATVSETWPNATHNYYAQVSTKWFANSGNGQDKAEVGTATWVSYLDALPKDTQLKLGGEDQWHFNSVSCLIRTILFLLLKRNTHEHQDQHEHEHHPPSPHVRRTNTLIGMFQAPVNGAHASEPMVSAALAEPATTVGTNV